MFSKFLNDLNSWQYHQDKLKVIALFSFFILGFIACKSEDNSDNGLTPISQAQLRIENASKLNFENVYVNTSGGEHVFDNISSGEKSEYQTFSFLYRYAFVELNIDGDTFTIQPIDYVGETSYSGGFYTYKIEALDSGGRYSRLSIFFVIEN